MRTGWWAFRQHGGGPYEVGWGSEALAEAYAADHSTYISTTGPLRDEVSFSLVDALGLETESC